MRMLTDNPTADDKYGFENYANLLTNAIIDTEDLPFLMGIYGAWGSGKSSLMLMIQNQLEVQGVKCIWFNPWKYDNKEDLWSALIQTILFKIADDKTITEELKTKLKRMAGNVAWSFVKTGVSTLTQGIVNGENLEAAREAFSKNAEDRHNYLNNFEQDFSDAIKDYTGDSRLVVFIDDLDRCSPENSITVLESLKLFIGNAGCVFVLGMDHRIVEQGIQFKYGGKIDISGREYLDKIIQVPFFVPPVPFTRLKEQLEAYTKTSNYSDEIWELMRQGFKCNPRKSKRFLNSYYFVLKIIEYSNVQYNQPNKSALNNGTAGASLTLELQNFLLAYLLIIQINFPEYYNFISYSGDIFAIYTLFREPDNRDLTAGRPNMTSDPLKEQSISNIRLRYPTLEVHTKNINLTIFIKETESLFEKFATMPSSDEILSLINTINLVSQTRSSSTTRPFPESSIRSKFAKIPKPHRSPSK